MKKVHKQLLALFLICSMLVSFVPAGSVGVTNEDVIVSLQIGNPIMEVNGVQAEIDAGRGTKPVVIAGRTLVPIRAIVEAFDGTVGWDGTTQTVTLSMDGEQIQLVINSKTAYLNRNVETLDVAPTIINGRTMLPIRFVAEGFNLGVAWDGVEKVVTVIRNGFDDAEYAWLMSVLPAYSGEPCVEINGNVPLFKEYEIIRGSFEYYSELDSFGRCDVCMASVAQDLMPTEKRESISSVIPSGWKSIAYESVEGDYLYNRCHLIGFQLTGENANVKNLITGTRYLNVDGMLPYENMIADYVEQTGNHVMYRSTPVFTGNNLVADGVLLEGYSVEDRGAGISFCVYCYNVQPNININYATGDSWSFVDSVVDQTPSVSQGTQTPEVGNRVYRTPSGKKYHFDPDCGGKNSYEVTMTEALGAGLTPCAKCAQ